MIDTMAKWLSNVAGSVLLLAAAGCSPSEHTMAPGAGPEPDGGPTPVKTVQVTSTVAELNGGAPIAGARICIVDRPEIPCATSGDDGSYTLSMPAWTTEVDLAYNVSAAGHLGDTELVHETPDGVQWGPIPLYLYDDATAAAELMNPAGFAYPTAGRGLVLLWVSGAPGMVSSAPAGTGPVYLDQTGTPDPTLIGPASNSYALLGNLDPGPIEISASDTSCVPAVFPVQTWADAKPATIAGVTVTNSITRMALACNSQ